MCLQPKRAGIDDWIDTGLFPPGGFVTAAMYFAMVSATEGNRELIADLPAECRALGKAQMMSIRGTAATYQTRLLGN
jgi:hypothetical protein